MGSASRTRCLSIAAGLCLFLSGAGYGADAPPPAGAVLHYEVAEAKTGKVLYTLRGWAEDDPGNGDAVVAVSNLIFPSGTQVDIHARFTRDAPPRCLSWRAVVRDTNGTEVAGGHEQMIQAAFPFLDRPVPPNTYPALAPLGYVLTRLGLGTKDAASFHFMLMGSSLLQMDLHVDGRDTVTVPGGQFDCHRVRMRVNAASLFPNLPKFLQPFVSFFIPTHTLWITTQEPQTLVKYTGQMGPPGSPELLIRLMAASDQLPR